MITEIDFIEKMEELIQCDYEYLDSVKYIFFAWIEFFDIDSDTALVMANHLANLLDGTSKTDIVYDLLSVIVLFSS